MMPNPKIVALVPMKHHSERVPRKNYRLFHGKPLYASIIETLKACPLLHSIAVNTDSPTIQEGLAHAYPSVQVIDRPESLRGDHVPMNDILLHDTSLLEADFYLQTHTTNPLLRPETVTHAIETFLAHYPMYDTLFSVTRLQTRLWDTLARPVNHNPNILLRTQDLPPLYEENSNLYLFTRETLVHQHNRIGDRPYLFEIERLEAWDIDDEQDFTIAEQLYAQQNT